MNVFISGHTSSCMRVCIHVHILIHTLHSLCCILRLTVLYLTSCTHCIKYCVIIISIILHFSEDSTCPGGLRHKPFGVSRGSPRSQLCI